MFNFNETLAFDVVHTFLAEFGEWITYTCFETGQQLSILAVIQRDVPTAIPGLTESETYKHEILVANDPTNGITSVTRGRDTVTLSSIYGGKTETFVVMQVIQSDPGAFHLGVG